jgi:aspartyl aminopeptidase
MTTEESANTSPDLLAFIDASPTPYHAVHESAERLRAGGFVELDEREEWQLEAGSRSFLIRGGGTLVAFVLGTEPPSRAGFVMVGAHTDSPNLRVKPLPELEAAGYRELAVEVYGGVLGFTWLDRDLSLAGRVSLKGGKSALVRFERPLCRIPNLAIHLDRDVNTRGLVVNPQTQLVPVLGTTLEGGADAGGLKRLLAAELERRGSGSFAPEEILAWDLALFDTAKAAFGGTANEFVFSARLDNLASCHAALSALLRAGEPCPATRVVLLYDHEEVGSQSAIGARSRLVESLLERLSEAYPGAGSHATARALARSLLVSTDMAHAVHPNYADKHDRQHRPQIGRGPVIKVNASQSYATEALGAAAFMDACRASGVSFQHFVSRNDMPCGSTIGPISAARLGVRTVDVGNPMLSMHSCREMAGAADVEPMIAALTALLSRPPQVDPRL